MSQPASKTTDKLSGDYDQTIWQVRTLSLWVRYFTLNLHFCVAESRCLSSSIARFKLFLRRGMNWLDECFRRSTFSKRPFFNLHFKTKVNIFDFLLNMHLFLDQIQKI